MQQSLAILDFCLRKTQSGKSRDYRDVIAFGKTPFSKCFPSARKRKAGVFKFLLFAERFRKAPSSLLMSVEGKPNRRSKAVFSNLLGRSVDAT